MNHGIFDEIFNKLINSYKKKYKKRFFKQHKKSNLLELFIDSTNIRNKNGKELIGVNYQDKFKKGNKVTVISDENKFPLSIDIHKANVHDAKILLESVDTLSKNVNIRINKIKLVGDKGYIVNGPVELVHMH